MEVDKLRCIGKEVAITGEELHRSSKAAGKLLWGRMETLRRRACQIERFTTNRCCRLCVSCFAMACAPRLDNRTACDDECCLLSCMPPYCPVESDKWGELRCQRCQ